LDDFVTNNRAHNELEQLVNQIDFDSEHYYNLYFEPTDDLPSEDVAAEIWTNLSSLMADVGKLRGEFARMRRGVDELRLPAIEAVGLDSVAEQLRSVEQRLRPLAEQASKPAEDESRVKRLLKDLLAVLDTLDRVFELVAAQPSSVGEGLRTGLDSLYRLFQETLERYGLEQMQVEAGSQFDPHEHLAMGVEANAELADGTVSRVMLKGYRLAEKPLRTAQVVVVKNRPA
jgi:molecular chaperone GrpE